MSKQTNITISLILAFMTTGCAVNPASSDQSTISAARNKVEEIKEAAGFAIMFCRENKIQTFPVRDVANRKMRNKLYNFGSTVYVADSFVTFKSLTIRYGIKEIIYDFATREREPDPSLQKVADRIYYDRRPFPLM